jgi:hypothetical protein
MNKEYKILVGVTKDNEIYFLQLRKGDDKQYFSMTGETVIPLELEEAKEQSYQNILSSVEDEVRNINPLFIRDIDEITQDIIESDGNLSGIDTSLFTEDVEVNGREYIFESGSCGQHEESDFKKLFIEQKAFDEFMKLWQQYHLKQLPKNSIAEDMADWFVEIAEKQNIKELAGEAVEFIINQEE